MWEIWSMDQACGDCERELGEGMGRLSVQL